MAIAEQLSLLNTDEALEITPKSCRLRKLILIHTKEKDCLELNLKPLETKS